MPSSRDRAIAAVRDETSSLRISEIMWLLTVRSLMYSSVPISRLERPRHV